MGQDIRKLMKDYQPVKSKLSAGHESRFEERLEFIKPKQRTGMPQWMRIAAVVLAMAAVGSFVYYSTLDDNNASDLTQLDPEESNANPETQITLGDLSPDLKKVEDYYMAGINVQLASLQVTEDNKELVDSYLLRLEELNKEYKQLNDELNEVGPTEVTITALIDNLQLRLEMLFKLKNKLKELKNQNNEDYNII